MWGGGIAELLFPGGMVLDVMMEHRQGQGRSSLCDGSKLFYYCLLYRMTNYCVCACVCRLYILELC